MTSSFGFQLRTVVAIVLDQKQTIDWIIGRSLIENGF